MLGSLVTLAGAALAGCHRKKPATPQPTATAQAPALPVAGIDRSHKGEAEPATPFARLDGGPATLSQFRGRPLLVNLWATWCGPCVREMPALAALARANEGRFAFVAVSEDMNGKDAVTPFLAAHKLTDLPVYLDTKNVLLTALKIDNLPETIFYDAHGREIWRVTGDMDWSSSRARALIDERSAG